MSISQLFDISRRSFRALDAAMNVVGQNVANADTPGYSRQRVTMRATSNVSLGYMSQMTDLRATGTGVAVASYERLRDNLLGSAAQEAQTALAGSDEEYRVLSAMESYFPTGAGSLQYLLDGFFTSWSDVADNPLDGGARAGLLSRAESLTGTLNRLSADLTSLQEETDAALDESLSDVNDLLGQLGELNETISAARANGTPDLSAEDRRDQLVKELSGYVPVRTELDEKGNYLVTIEGMAAVQGTNVVPLERDLASTTPAVQFAGTGVSLNLTSGQQGRIGAQLQTLTQDLPDALTSLDSLAAGLVASVNALHAGGTGLDGVSGRSFFDPTGVTAATIGLSSDVAGTPDAIGASGDGATGDSSVALEIAALRTGAVVGTETAEAFVTSLVSGIGASASEASTRAAGQAVVAGQLESLERGISGVSIDEEMTQMIELQQSFAATARVLNTAQEMMDTLLAL